MRHKSKLSKKQSPKTDEKLERMSNIPYASAVGSIQYAVQCTKPDVAYALA
ncbi:UNVERIFIED_CONTAM: Retrovirus-related Pol polyprotein from transposon TNT 1-94 [Sesamum latifolium]|uniref:Retrovirus-related Pol polyprotein from transposon TNT 1-94 n=1 Tax=Sesamum latifolium TaxID=2727402 RepID=A0AAW2UVS3_9LAMI